MFIGWIPIGSYLLNGDAIIVCKYYQDCPGNITGNLKFELFEQSVDFPFIAVVPLFTISIQCYLRFWSVNILQIVNIKISIYCDYLYSRVIVALIKIIRKLPKAHFSKKQFQIHLQKKITLQTAINFAHNSLNS